MIILQIQHNIAEKIAFFKVFRLFRFREARRSALSSTGFAASNEIRNYVESAGEGSWRKAHPLTAAFEKHDGKWQRRGGFISPYYGLGKFARYKIMQGDSELKTGFGTFSSRDIKRGKPAEFTQRLQEIAQQAQTRHRVLVSPVMRRLLGATKPKKNAVIGVDYFPIRKNTISLNIPARPIVVPVFQKAKGKLAAVFFEKFTLAIKKRFENEKRS